MQPDSNIFKTYKLVLIMKKIIKALISFILLSIVIVAVSFYFIFDKVFIGPVFLGLGFITLFALRFFKIEIKTIYPDFIFGFIDNGVLVFAAVWGGQIAGIVGAVIGGAVGNTVTDGIGGLFEGHIAEHQRKYKIDSYRTPLSTSLGKMAGCLFGAGVGLISIWLFSFIQN